MVVSAQPVTPSLGMVVAMGSPDAIKLFAWKGQALEATTPSFLSRSFGRCNRASNDGSVCVVDVIAQEPQHIVSHLIHTGLDV